MQKILICYIDPAKDYVRVYEGRTDLFVGTRKGFEDFKQKNQHVKFFTHSIPRPNYSSKLNKY
ncbi:MAG: hypothetical protein K0S34_1165 [Bacillales bacterium]|jgi:hypothetical protein|nr:hypothetical protein [Bacillales bacterium]